MSPRSSDSPAKKQSSPPDVYVALLFVAVAALALGITFLVLELKQYGWEMAP
jgi:hypothetical protein